jgi:hypothetical protein
MDSRTFCLGPSQTLAQYSGARRASIVGRHESMPSVMAGEDGAWAICAEVLFARRLADGVPSLT